MWRFWFSDRVSPMTLTSYFSTARLIVAPAAADVQQRHAGLEAQLAQREVDLRHLRLLEGVVVLLEVGAAVDLVRVLPELEELVGDVVVELDFLLVRPARLARGLGQQADSALCGVCAESLVSLEEVIHPPVAVERRGPANQPFLRRPSVSNPTPSCLAVEARPAGARPQQTAQIA